MYRPLKALAFLAVAAVSTTPVFADDCDYVGRHYKTDLMPVGGTTYAASRSGDILLPPSVAIDVRNVGVNAIDDPNPSGLIHARRIALGVKGQILYGFLPAPLAPGQTARVSFNLPEGLVGRCEETTFTIDADAQVGQHGCQIHANDAITFVARFGSRLCRSDVVIRPMAPEHVYEDVSDALDDSTVDELLLLEDETAPE